MIKSPTRGNVILDLSLTTIPDTIRNVHIKDGISDHDVVVFDAIVHHTHSGPACSKKNIYFP